MGEELSKMDLRPPIGLGLFPVVRLIGAIRLAFNLRKLVIATLGLIVFQIGSSALDTVFPGSSGIAPDVFPSASPGSFLALESTAVRPLLHSISEPIRLLTGPLFAFTEPGAGWRKSLHGLLSVLWAIIVWGVCGGAIARIAMIQVAKIEPLSIVKALKFASRSAGTLIMAPVCPLLGLAVCAILGAAFRLVYHVPAVGPVVAGVILPLPLALGFVMTALVAGLIAGWPLMVAAAASGAENPLDAWSRTFSYLNQRIGQLLALLLFVVLQGIIGLILVDLFTAMMIRLTLWDLGLTASPGSRAALLDDGIPGLSGFAGMTHQLWLAAVALGARSWTYSYCWTSAAILYLWARHDVDGTPWDEIDRPTANIAT